MFRIVQQVPDIFPQVGKRILDDLQVILEFDPQCLENVNIPAFPKDSDCWRFGGQQCLKVGILLGRILEVTGGAKGGQFGVLQIDIAHHSKIFNRQRIGTWPTALDEIDPELIELPRYPDFIAHR